MKRRIVFSTTPVVSVLLALVFLIGEARQTSGQVWQGVLTVKDTGTVTVGPNQLLRITVINGANKSDNDKGIRVGFRRLEYTQGPCSGGVCVHTVASQNATDPLTLAPGEAASFDIPNTAFGVRGIVLSSSQNVRVTALIIDTATGSVSSMSLLDEDYKPL